MRLKNLAVQIEEVETEVGPHSIFSRSVTRHAPVQAPCMVLVHGYVASSSYMVPLMRTLAPHARLHAPDLPCWGRSDAAQARPSVTYLAHVLAAWLSKRELERPVLLGNSLGCQIVVELASQLPHMLSAAILLGPSIDPGARTLRTQAWRLILDVPRERPSLWLVELRDLWRMGPRCAAETLKAMMGDRIEENLPSVTCPALVLRGCRDPICSQPWAERATQLLPRGELVVLPNTGHAANYSAPGKVVQAVLPFLRRLQDEVV